MNTNFRLPVKDITITYLDGATEVITRINTEVYHIKLTAPNGRILHSDHSTLTIRSTLTDLVGPIVSWADEVYRRDILGEEDKK